MTQPIRILVFGTTGTGKTSLCNTLTGEKQPVSDKANGVTFQYHHYNPVNIENKILLVTDSVGLNESDRGAVSTGDALENLLSLMKDSKDGYNLLVHVMRIPRITIAEQNNYDFFIKKIGAGRIPSILVATGCENREPMQIWANENSPIFFNHGMKYNDIICTCFAEGGRFGTFFDELRNESKSNVLAAIFKYSTEVPVLLYKNESEFRKFFKNLWNRFVELLELPNGWKMSIDEQIITLLTRIGISKERAEKIVSRWTNW